MIHNSNWRLFMCGAMLPQKAGTFTHKTKVESEVTAVARVDH